MTKTFVDRQASVPLQQLPRDQIRPFSDLAIACALIVFTLPLMAMVALAIKCGSPGPVLERTECIKATSGRRFVSLRFRTTMQHARVGRVNVTSLGRFLRFVRIDELPQLINVVRGHLRLADFR